MEMASSAALLKSSPRCLATAKQGSRAAAAVPQHPRRCLSDEETERVPLLCGSGYRGVGGPQGPGRASHASCQAGWLLAWQPSTQTGTCNAKPANFLRLIGKLQVCEGTLAYLHNQFGLIFYQDSSFKPIQYSIQTFGGFKFLGLF